MLYLNETHTDRTEYDICRTGFEIYIYIYIHMKMKHCERTKCDIYIFIYKYNKTWFHDRAIRNIIVMLTEGIFKIQIYL